MSKYVVAATIAIAIASAAFSPTEAKQATQKSEVVSPAKTAPVKKGAAVAVPVTPSPVVPPSRVRGGQAGDLDTSGAAHVNGASGKWVKANPPGSGTNAGKGNIGPKGCCVWVP